MVLQTCRYYTTTTTRLVFTLTHSERCAVRDETRSLEWTPNGTRVYSRPIKIITIIIIIIIPSGGIVSYAQNRYYVTRSPWYGSSPSIAGGRWTRTCSVKSVHSSSSGNNNNNNIMTLARSRLPPRRRLAYMSSRPQIVKGSRKQRPKSISCQQGPMGTRVVTVDRGRPANSYLPCKFGPLVLR